MKKIIWVFGESATGKKTFIENILNGNLNILEDLELNNKRIDVVRRTIDKNLSSFDDVLNEKSRYQIIIEEINNFINNDYDILLLKGQSNDMDDRYGNTLNSVAMLYPEIEKEIYLLEVKDMDLLYNRIQNKDWFKVDFEKYSSMFPREWIDNAVIRHREQVYSFADFYMITDVDSTNGYKISNLGKVR